MMLLLFATITLWCYSDGADVKCTGDAMSKPQIVNNDTCFLACGAKEKCYCDDTSASKSFKNCNQQCRVAKMPNNETIQECPDMECKGFDVCYQGCFGTRCPKTYCKSRKSCNQECAGQCTKLVCSSPECIQECSNCTMECTSEVKKCSHFCRGGHCKSICGKNSECKCETYSNPSTKCTVVIAAHAAKASAPFYAYLIALFFFVKNIA